jgi:proteasome activator subunit 4
VHDRTQQDRFVKLAKKSHIPSRQSPEYGKAIRQRHAAILGICALIDSFPYTVEKWMPDLLTSVLAEHTYDPVSLPLNHAPSVFLLHVPITIY